MPFQQHQSLRYWTFKSLLDQPLKHAVFTRQGGVSTAPFTSLNLSRSVGDNEENVRENEQRIFDALGLDIASAADSFLEHGTKYFHATKPASSRDGQIQYADILLTDNPNVTLFMRYGDCYPILLYDPSRKALGLAHAGWRGTLLGVISEAVAAMEERFRSRPGDLIAAIGPGVCVQHYEVGKEVIQAVRDRFEESSDEFLLSNGAGTHFNLAAANRYLLEQVGVGQIEECQLCTAEHLDDWFSHRAEYGKTGRFGVIMALES